MVAMKHPTVKEVETLSAVAKQLSQLAKVCRGNGDMDLRQARGLCRDVVEYWTTQIIERTAKFLLCDDVTKKPRKRRAG
jgi:hypothetical protein